MTSKPETKARKKPNRENLRKKPVKKRKKAAQKQKNKSETIGSKIKGFLKRFSGSILFVLVGLLVFGAAIASTLSLEEECEAGYKHLESISKCQDIDECQQDLHQCFANETCQNTGTLKKSTIFHNY